MAKRKSGITVTVDFKDLLEKIQEAGGDIEAATFDAARKSAKVIYNELLSESKASGLPESVTSAISFQAERDESGNRYGVTVGWKLGAFNPKNPSAGHKAIFQNYGTPHRYTKLDRRVPAKNESGWATTNDRGFITGRGFIARAKKKAQPKVKKIQQETLNEILRGLKQ